MHNCACMHNYACAQSQFHPLMHVSSLSLHLRSTPPHLSLSLSFSSDPPSLSASAIQWIFPGHGFSAPARLYLQIEQEAVVAKEKMGYKICCRGNRNSRRTRCKCIHDDISQFLFSSLFWCPRHVLSGISNFWRFLSLCCIWLFGQNLGIWH